MSKEVEIRLYLAVQICESGHGEFPYQLPQQLPLELYSKMHLNLSDVGHNQTGRLEYVILLFFSDVSWYRFGTCSSWDILHLKINWISTNLTHFYCFFRTGGNLTFFLS